MHSFLRVAALLVLSALCIDRPHAHDFTEPGGTSPGLPNNNQTQPVGCPGCSHCVQQAADPVYLVTGDLIRERQDLLLPGRLLDLDITFVYRSRSAYNGPYGYGWDMAYNVRLKRLENGNALILTGSNRDEEYTWIPGIASYQTPPLVYWTLKLNPDGTHTRTFRDGLRQSFDLNGCLTRVEDRFGNAISFTYTPDPMPIIGTSDYFVDQRGGVISREYLLLSITDTVGRAVTFQYDSTNRLETMTCQDRVWRYEYRPSGNGDLLAVTAPGTDLYPTGTTIQYDYDPQHNLTTVTDAEGQTFLENTYDLITDRIKTQRWGNGTYVFTYNGATTTVMDPRGVVTSYVLNSLGLPTEEKTFTDGVPAGEPAFYRTTHEYNSVGQRLRTVWPRGNATEWKYNFNGQVAEIRRKRIGAIPFVPVADDIVTQFTYESTYAQLASITDANGKKRFYTFDSGVGEPNLGLPKKLTLPHIAAGKPEFLFTYTVHGQLETVTDPNGNVTKLTYDQTLFFLRTLTRAFGTPDAATMRFNEDGFGNQTSIVNGEGQSRTFVYDAQNHLRHALALNVPDDFELRYDKNGNVIEARGSGVPGGFLAFDYTELDWLRGVTNALNESTLYEHDNGGNVRLVTDPKGNATAYEYDERNLPTKQIDANQGQLILGYDDNGNTTSLRDPGGNLTRWEYDDFDRATILRYPVPSTATEQYEYDKLGNLKATVDPKGQRIERDYDPAYQKVSAERWFDAQQTTFGLAYDLGGRLLSVQDPGYGTMTFTYDRADRLKSESTPHGRTVAYQYDLANRLKKLTYPDGSFLTHLYDSLDRLTQITEGPQAVFLATFEYDSLGRRERVLLADGTTTQYDYDDASRVAGLAVTGGASGPQFIGYHYDANGNPIRRERDGRVTYFGYDKLNQLIYEGGADPTVPTPDGGTGGGPIPLPPTFEYDANGNRLSSRDGGATATYIPNHLNQYTSVGGIPHTYDTNGNLIFDGSVVYIYDFLDRLAETQGSFGTARYKYDVFGRIVQKAVNGTIVNVVPAGDQIAEETSGSNAQVAEYVYGQAVDEPLRMNRLGQDHYFHADKLGSVLYMTSPNGQLEERYTYSGFGRTTVSDGTGQPLAASIIGNPFGFAGREYNNHTGSYQNRYREYLPQIGRFASREPLGYWPDANVYRYVGNSATRWRDPFGLQSYPELYAGDPDLPLEPVYPELDIALLASGLAELRGLLLGAKTLLIGATRQRTGSVCTNSLAANPFKGKSVDDIAEMFMDKGFTPKGTDPLRGRGTFVHPNTGRPYHIDAGHLPPKGPHIGVGRPRGRRDLPPRDYEL